MHAFGLFTVIVERLRGEVEVKISCNTLTSH